MASIEYHRQWRVANREKLRKQAEDRRRAAGIQPRQPGKSRRHYQLMIKYGISEQEYDDLLRKQGGGCAVCHSKTRLVVDHCHTTNRVRGILCSHCNIGLGHFFDSPLLLAGAAKYLQEN